MAVQIRSLPPVAPLTQLRPELQRIINSNKGIINSQNQGAERRVDTEPMDAKLQLVYSPIEASRQEPRSTTLGIFYKALLEVVLLVSAAMLLCLFVPAMVLLELFLVLLGGLVIAAGVSTLNNLIHNHKVQQMLREIELEKLRRQLPSLEKTGGKRGRYSTKLRTQQWQRRDSLYPRDAQRDGAPL